MLAIGAGAAGYWVFKQNQEQVRSGIEGTKETGETAWNKEAVEYGTNSGVLADPADLEAATPTATLAPTGTPKPTGTTGGPISLTATTGSSGITLKWTVSGIDTNLGFKIVRSTEVNPVYPGDEYKYLSEPAVRQYTWNIQDGKTYHFRVCKYLEDNKCGVYSNDVTGQAPTGGESDEVTAITLKSDGGNKISWTVNGISDQGFKIVWSKNSQPTYPLRNEQDKYHYYSEPDKRSDELEAFSGSGKYYVRVCEYLDGKCGVYSNQIEAGL